MKRSLMAALLLSVAACGGSSSPAAPTTTTSTPTATTLTFTSTVTGSPVAGATVVVGGTTYTTNADGSVTLSTSASTGATIDVSAPGFLDRATLLGVATALTLWEIPAGADANFVRQLAYNRAGTPEVLWRPGVATIFLRLTGELANDPAVRAAHVQAAAMATSMAGGKATISLDAPAGGMVVTLLVNASNGANTTYLTQSGGSINSARVEYADITAARTARVVAHELGHVLGFGHAPTGLMCPTACGADNFSPQDQAVYLSMWQRRPGTAPLDNDRSLGALSASSTTALACDIK